MIKNILSDFNKSLEIIKSLKKEELQKEELPETLKGINTHVIKLAYAKFIDSSESYNSTKFELHFNKAIDIISKLNKQDFLEEEIPDELKRVDLIASKLAYKCYLYNNMKSFPVNNLNIGKIKNGFHWCTRDFGGVSSPWGNHHFILFVSEDEKTLFKDKMVKKNDKYYACFCGNKSEKFLKEFVNDYHDKKSITEKKHWYWPDLDLQHHHIEELQDGGDFTNPNSYFKNYFNNQKNKNVPKYDLNDCNCASWVNTFFKTMGVGKRARIKYGEFWGIDWAEEQTFETKYFTDYIRKK